MENFGSDGTKEMLFEPLDYGGKAPNDQKTFGIEFSQSKIGGGMNSALYDKGDESVKCLSQFDEEHDSKETISAPWFVMDAGREDLKDDRVHCRYEEARHQGFIKYGIDELLGLWEVAVNCEKTWNDVHTALSPLMEEMYAMQALPDTKSPRRRGKNSERRQRFKARREAMLSISQNHHGESKNEDCDDTTDSNAQISDEYQVVRIQKGPLKGSFKPRQYDYYSDEYVGSFQPQAFAVDGEPDFESGDPQDGWEYLRRVIWEAARCPKVVVADIDPGKLVSEQTPYMPKIPAIPSSPPDLLPSKEWERLYLADFTQLRKELSKLQAPTESSKQRLPSVVDQAAWEILCFGAVRSARAEDLEVPESVTIEATYGASTRHEEIDGATDDEFIIFHPPLTGTSNHVVSGEKACVDQVSDSPLLDELERHSTRGDTGNDDTMQVGSEEGTAAEHQHPTEPPDVDMISASGCNEAPGDSTRKTGFQVPSVPFEHEGGCEVTADLVICNKPEESDLLEPDESHEEDHVENVTLLHGNLASSDVQGSVAPLLETTGIHVQMEDISDRDGEELSTVTILTDSCVHSSDIAQQSNYYAAATEFADTFDGSSEPYGPGVCSYTPKDTAESRDLLYDPVDPIRDDVTYDYPAESYDFAAPSHEAFELEDDNLPTACLMESHARFEVFSAKNILESEGDDRGSISEIVESVQQLFSRVFRVDKAWELPLVHVLLRLDIVSRATLFRYHVSWLDSLEDLPQERALWLLGLACVVDTPLNGDTTAAFRAMLRHCAGVRASRKALNGQERERLNALITIAGLYFGQAEADLT